MTEYAHAHPMSEGRRFEHVHQVPAASPSTRETMQALHAAQPLEQAHPDMADVAHAPEPGSPADYRRAAAELRERAAHFRNQADRCEHTAAELEAQAAQDEAEPPDTGELLRRILDRGKT